MSEVLEYTARLSQVIGPRPAGTEEEQQASFFIEENLRQTAGLDTEIEEFNCNPNYELPRIVCAIASVVLGALAIFLPLMVLPATIITVITAALFITDMLGVSLFSRFGNHGISQNVIARYVPQTPDGQPQSRQARKRKIVLIAHYDSGRIRREAKAPMLGALNIIYWIQVVCMAIVPIALILRLATSAQLTLVPALNILLIIGIVGSLLPIIGYVMHQTAPYNNAANVNASGVAVLLDLAQKVNLEPEAQEDQVTIHGEEAAYEAGVVPEGAQLVYDTQPTGSLEPVDQGILTGFGIPAQSSDVEGVSVGSSNNANYQDALAQGSYADTLQAQSVDASAVSATTSETNSYFDYDSSSTQVSPQIAEAIGSASLATSAATTIAQAAEDPNRASAVTEVVEENVPDWYRKARAKANKQQTYEAPAQRSRFADALDTAEAVSANAMEREAQEAVAPTPSAAEQRLAQMRANMMSDLGANPAQAADAQQSSNLTHAGQGVDGYLSSMTSASTYAASNVAAEAHIAADAAQVAAQTSQAATMASMRAANMAENVATLADMEAAAAASDLTPEQEAVANRTISFIPVAVDPEEILHESDQLKAQKAIDAGQEYTATGRKKRTISLPSLTGAIEGLNAKLQEAPLEENVQDEQSRLEARRSRQESLASIPLTTGQAIEDDVEYEQQNVSQAGSFVAADATTSFAPVGDELIADMDDEDIYIEDADDSDYAEQFTSAGAPVGPGYVDIPSSRRSKLFGRFRRKKQDDDISLGEAIGVDEDFDARSVGAARGGWESFRQEDEEDEWRGGGFSRSRKTVSATDDDLYDAEDVEIEEEIVEEPDVSEAPQEDKSNRRRSRRHDPEEEGTSRRRRDRSVSPFGDLPLLANLDLAEEREAIQQFNSGMISTEVWFVALGAEIANNAGIANLIDLHRDELKGSIIIDLDGLGAGDLSLIEEEGVFKHTKVSSRMKRYVTKAASALGMHVGSGRMVWRNSGAYYAARKGFQTLHLAGMLDGKTAYACETDDVIENVSEDTLQANSAFVMEVLRNI